MSACKGDCRAGREPCPTPGGCHRDDADEFTTFLDDVISTARTAGVLIFVLLVIFLAAGHCWGVLS
ncbi:hypothetical protein [Curvibacter lanceolatus]|uniref:hypothetical protein n=1 Tax=Curvibacter lanceolatus TaxID=86182 RepID=UPI0003680055|nr:hypothetical protein [Curvibacter lanceolatus]